MGFSAALKHFPVQPAPLEPVPSSQSPLALDRCIRLSLNLSLAETTPGLTTSSRQQTLL